MAYYLKKNYSSEIPHLYKELITLLILKALLVLWVKAKLILLEQGPSIVMVVKYLANK